LLSSRRAGNRDLFALFANRIRQFRWLLPVLPIASGSLKKSCAACASHSGEPIHTEVVASMLKKIGWGLKL